MGDGLYSKFDELSGEYAYDSSGYGHTGHLRTFGGPPFSGTTTFDPNGKFNGCVKFDDKGMENPYTRVDYGDILNIKGDLSISLWFNCSKGLAPLQWLVCRQADTSPLRYSLGLIGVFPTYLNLIPQFLLGAYQPHYPPYEDWAFLCVITGEELTHNEWHFITVVRNAGTGAAKMRVDNKWYYATTAIPGQIRANGVFSVGDGASDVWWGRQFVGRIDETRVTDGVLTDAQIDSLFNQSIPTPIIPTVKYDMPLDTFPSSVRVGTRHNRRTRRGFSGV